MNVLGCFKAHSSDGKCKSAPLIACAVSVAQISGDNI